MPIAAALSEHPVAAHAVGEVVGQVLERAGEEPDLALLFASAPHTGALEDVVSTIRTLLRPGVLAGSTAVSVLAGGQEVEDTPAIALWTARWGRPVEPVRLVAEPAGDRWMVDGMPDATPGDTLLLLSDPFSFPADRFVDELGETRPGVTVVGGMASAARGPGGNRLVLDGALHDDGAVGVLLDASVPVRTLVSQGCRPIGSPLVVTKGEGQVIYELAGRTALERLEEVVRELSPEDRSRAAQGLHLGRVIDERKVDFDRGDFLIRNVLGADREVGAIAVGDVVEVGQTVQFQVRDASSADEDLHSLLHDSQADRPPSGALVFTCNGRGRRLFGTPHHDAAAVAQMVPASGVAGMFCAGELGPVGGRSFLHGFTASVLLFDDPGGGPAR
jgi:small ligand-binding sensory domain FIST